MKSEEGAMPIINCPVCKNTGEEGLNTHAAFEVRGQYQGQAVRKCNNCGAGLLLGTFSGILWGQPKVIPAGIWEKMQGMWDGEFNETS